MSAPTFPSVPSGPTTAAPPHRAVPTQTESIRDTLISVVIAFALAFVFRGFVIEAFVIPTGSMAPTLMGAHMRFRGPQTGYSWPVGPWDRTNGPDYAPIQPPGGGQVPVHDPISGEVISPPPTNVPLRSGDRILVLKYLYSVQGPSRYDVVVFKNPTDPSVNYIKRLVGLPGEEIALVDGDVFARPAGHAPDDPAKGLWAQSTWKIARKERAQQLAVWQTVFDSEYAPAEGGGASAAGPWNTADKGAWTFSGADYAFTPKGGAAQSELFFDKARKRFTGASPSQPASVHLDLWSIDDRYAYDETPTAGAASGAAFPVSDVRMRAGVEPQPGSEGLRIEATVRARGMDFQAVLEGATGTIRSRRLMGAAGVAGAWETLGAGPISPLRPGHVADVEFWHADQALQLWVDGRLVARSEYDWTPAERIAAATGMEVEQVFQSNPGNPNPLQNGELYRARSADVRWGFSGAAGGLVMHRVGIDRDLHYQPAIATTHIEAALATSPTNPLRLTGEQVFCCGDNSPQSLDGRLWGPPEPWVAYEFGASPGVVPRDLLLGKAFFVYWPAPHWNLLPIPDFGRMRFIR